MTKIQKLDDKNDHRGLKLDAKDIENIRNCIRLYEKLNPPGKVNYMQEGDKTYVEICNIKEYLEYVRRDIKNTRRVKTKSFDEPMRLTTSVPPGLKMMLDKGYPTLFTDKGQTAQFLKAFPLFNLEK